MVFLARYNIQYGNRQRQAVTFLTITLFKYYFTTENTFQYFSGRSSQNNCQSRVGKAGREGKVPGRGGCGVTMRSKSYDLIPNHTGPFHMTNTLTIPSSF